MKMNIKLVKSTYDWDADSTDFEESEFESTPNKVYQEITSEKMENCALKQKGAIK